MNTAEFASMDKQFGGHNFISSICQLVEIANTKSGEWNQVKGQRLQTMGVATPDNNKKIDTELVILTEFLAFEEDTCQG